MTDVVIVDAVRTPMGRSKGGAFRNVRAEESALTGPLRAGYCKVVAPGMDRCRGEEP